jgi:hypothetical protein
MKGVDTRLHPFDGSTIILALFFFLWLKIAISPA